MTVGSTYVEGSQASFNKLAGSGHILPLSGYQVPYIARIKTSGSGLGAASWTQPPTHHPHAPTW